MSGKGCCTFLFILFFMLSAQSCNAGKTDSELAPDKPSVQNLMAKETFILKQISNTIRLGCTEDNQCSSVPAGVNPCGGVGRYFVFSKQETDENKLHRLVGEYNRLNRYLNEKLGRIGSCVFLEAPQAVCNQGGCAAKTNLLVD